MQFNPQNMKLIRRGNNSEIYFLQKEDQQLALKAVSINFTKESKHLLNQWKLLNSISHPNIIKIYHWTSNVQLINNSTYNVLAQEYAQQGNLIEYLKTHKITLKQKIAIMKNIFSAVEYLHSNYFVHRDLKLDNILIFQEDGKIVPKIADFGFSLRIKDSSEKLNTFKGTRRGYMSPQIHLCLNSSEAQYQVMPTDVFSIGVALFALIMQKLPFEYATKTDPLYKFIYEDRFEQFWNFHRISLQKLKQNQQDFKEQQFCSLIQNLLQFEPSQRMSLGEALEHPFFNILK